MDDSAHARHPIFENIHIGIGTWAWGDRLYWGFGNGYQEKDLREAFKASLNAGIQFFDTAEVYGQGRSEMFLGEFLRGCDQEVKIASKFMPFPWRLTRHSLLNALQGSLKRLGLQKINLYQLHFPLPPIKIETWMSVMSEAAQKGWTEAVGISNCDRAQMQRAYDALEHEHIPLASNQVEYHLLDRKVEKNGLLNHCRELGVTPIAYSPLAMGALTGKYSPNQPLGGIRGQRYNQKLAAIQPLIIKLRDIGLEHNSKSPAQVALNWCICKGVIPIPGAKNIDQAEQNAAATGWRLTNDEVAALDEISDRVSTAE